MIEEGKGSATSPLEKEQLLKAMIKANTGKNKTDIEQVLAQGHAIQIKPKGYSMYPLFVPGRDEAIIEPVDPAFCKRGDIVLYRREKGILVMHRIWKRDKTGFYMVGDNQKEIEGPLKASQIRGIMTAMVRNGRRISVTNPVYRLLTSFWLLLRPLRPVLSHAAAPVFKRIRKWTKR